MDEQREPAVGGDREQQVQALLDREQIRDVVLRYCRGIDRRDWALVRSCYHDDAVDHHGRFRGSADEFVAWIAGFLPRFFEQTVHSSGNCLIELDGDVARVETYVVAYHRGTPPGREERADMVVAGRLHDRFERRDGTWRIAYRELIYDWTRIDPIVDEYPLAEGSLVGRASRDDPSFLVDPSLRGAS